MGGSQSTSSGATPAAGSAAPEPPITRYPSFKLILVRHGVSCANLKKAMGQSFSSYRDPELTRAGQEKAIQRGHLFRKYLLSNNLLNPIVTASILMRTQQTAFLMMSADTESNRLKQLAVIPYVSEIGSSFWFQTNENKRIPVDDQEEIMGRKTLLGHRIFVPQPLPSDADIPSPAKFISWIENNYNDLRYAFPEVALTSSLPTVRTRSDPLRPLVVFTHGNFIQTFIKYVTKTYPHASTVSIEKSDRPNYSAFEFTVYILPSGRFRIQYDSRIQYSTPFMENSKTLNIEEECDGDGDMCRYRVCPVRSETSNNSMNRKPSKGTRCYDRRSMRFVPCTRRINRNVEPPFILPPLESSPAPQYPLNMAAIRQQIGASKDKPSAGSPNDSSSDSGFTMGGGRRCSSKLPTPAAHRTSKRKTHRRRR
jgi:broad specificity phosphatase PhoE